MAIQPTQHRGVTATNFQGRILIGDLSTGMIYTQDSNYFYDDSGPAFAQRLILKRRITPTSESEGAFITYDRLTINMEANNITMPEHLQLSWSDDGGITFTTTPLNIRLLPATSTLQRVQFNRLGKARWRVWQLDISAPVRTVITGAEAEIRKGRK